MSFDAPEITWQQVRPEAYRVRVWRKAGVLIGAEVVYDSGWIPDQPTIPPFVLREGYEYDIEAMVQEAPTRTPF